MCFLADMSAWITETESGSFLCAQWPDQGRAQSMCSVNDCWLTDWSLRAGSVEALSFGT